MTRKEAKTRKELIDPKLADAGWAEHDWQYEPSYAITDGRIHWDGKTAKRSRPLYADYLLRYKPSLAIAVVEAKDSEFHHLEGAAQAKEYATKLGLWFAYSTNGHEIEFFDLKAGTQETVKRFHTPEELWQMYLTHAGLKPSEKNVAAVAHDFYDESQIGQRRRPRYYQEKAVRAAVESILNGKKRVLITQATGTGKTFCSMQLVYKLFKSKVAKKILFIVDRNLLADQAFNDFNNAMDKDACYRLSPKDERFPLGRDLYFGIYQTLVGIDDEGNNTGKPDRYREFPADFFDLIVIDEAHRGGANKAGSWFRLLEYFKSAIQVGLTATPKREESNDTYKYFGSPVVNYSLKDGIQDGFLSPYIIKRVTSNIDALGYHPEHQEIKDVRGRVIPHQDYFTPDFERKLSIPQRSRAFAYHLLRHLFSTDPLGKTLVFCVDQQHALDMAKYVNEAFAKYKEKYQFDYAGTYSIRITGNDKDPNGKYPWLEKFANLDGYEPIVVTTSKLLTTGIDVRNIKNVVIFRNIGSMVEFKQVIGRGTRIYESRDRHRQKLGFFILEYANFSTQLFNDPEWDDAPTEVIDEGGIAVPEEADADPETRSTPDTLPAPPPADQEDHGKVDSNGIFVEPDEEQAAQLRYRMSDEFLKGQISIPIETISYTGPDGKPLPPDKYILFQSEALRSRFASFAALQKTWADSQARKNFIREEASDIGVHIDALTQLFFEKHKQREVDTLDVLGNLVFGENYLTKEERIKKARALHKHFFDAQPDKAKALIQDLLGVYQEMDFNPFTVSSELWQIPQIRKHGTPSEIRTLVGGQEILLGLINGLQAALYDVRIAA
jgi:type I restriction enzyme R subunit